MEADLNDLGAGLVVLASLASFAGDERFALRVGDTDVEVQSVLEAFGVIP